MKNNKIAAAALVAALPLVAAVSLVGSAHAAQAPAATSSITARASDKTPASGKAFTVSGTFKANNQPAVFHEVKIQTNASGSWKTLPGAHDQTTKTGVYQLKVILNAKGPRQLRAVGVGQGSEPNARKVLTLTVH